MKFSGENLASAVFRPVTWLTLLFCLALVVGYAVPQTWLWPSERLGPIPDVATGEERLLVYIGSATCGPSNDADMSHLLDAIRVKVAQSAERDGRRFVTVGIAKDGDVAAGLQHLESMGRFDEIMTGRSWANIGLLKYVFSDLRGPAATPQVIVVDRRVLNQGVHVEVTDEQVLARRIGLQELREWVKAADDF